MAKRIIDIPINDDPFMNCFALDIKNIPNTQDTVINCTALKRMEPTCNTPQCPFFKTLQKHLNQQK